MLAYTINKIPDLTLSKYQAFSDTGIEGMLNAHTQFIKQLYRIAVLYDISIHFIFYYDSNAVAGNKLKIKLLFIDKNSNYSILNKLQKFIEASSIYNYFEMSRCDIHDYKFDTFCNMSVMSKKERFLQTTVNNEEKYFYLVPNWEMNKEARLYNLFQLMQSFDENCCYRVDLYAEKNIEEQIHKNFERPLSYLRNFYNVDKGISEYSKIKKEDRDPNVDEILHQYEDWIKKIDTSLPFSCRISAFTKDEDYGQLLLDTAFSEAVNSGNVKLKSEQGNYTIFSEIDTIPVGYCADDTPKSMQKWSTTFTIEEIASFTRLPILYDGENIEIPKETYVVQQETGIVLGKDKNKHPVYIPQKNLPKHMFVCGVPGAGKTNTMLHIANSLWNSEFISENGEIKKSKIPFLVLEPAKKEYRELALFDIPELIVFSPSACTNFPLRINPFEFPKGLTLSEHISKLCQVFEGSFPIAPPAPFILDKAIQVIYENKGWNVKDMNTGDKEYPIMSELYEQFEKELQKTNYDSEIQGNIRSVLEMRIGSLLKREMKEIFDVPKSTLSPEEWLEYPIIIELESLGEGPANFVTLLLCTLIREVLKVEPMKDKEKPVRHVIFIEEAHNLIAPEAQVKDGQDSNPKIAATSFIVKMLAEVRALREGIIIADQLPTAMAPEVIKNTNVKLVHRLTAADDRELVGSTMSASGMQLESMATYTSGQALFTYEKLWRPFEMQVELVAEHGEKTPSDAELYELMLKKPNFYRLQKNDEIKKWETLKRKVQDLINVETKAIKQLSDFDLNNREFAEFERYIETCANNLNGILLLKKRLLLECSLLSENFIDIDKQSELINIIQQIGSKYSSNIRQFVNCY